MDLQYLEQIVKLFEESTLSELEIEEDGSHIRLGKGGAAQMQYAMQPQVVQALPSSSQTTSQAAAPAAGGHEVKSPIVGTYYSAPAPDAEPYVQVGQRVEVGAILCIVEAMKLMNEIESDTAGTVKKILSSNGQPVEYGQALFIIEP